MSAYNELIKNFEKIRDYMREFYVYGFKSRSGYNLKSARTYDDERRRLESWFGDSLRYIYTPEGKIQFFSIDSRATRHNPFYRAFKAKSFTDGDITLHFLLLDIFYAPSVSLSLSQILREIDGYLLVFDTPMLFDESTVRKKLKEYCEMGILQAEKAGRKTLYRRTKDLALPDITNLLCFFSEAAPCGVIGSFLLDKADNPSAFPNPFVFKHHYITSAMDSDVLATLFSAMQKKYVISAVNHGRPSKKSQTIRMIPLRVFISVQNGRQHLLAYVPEIHSIQSFRIDYLTEVKLERPTPRFDELRRELDQMQTKMWGVTGIKRRRQGQSTEHIDFTVKIDSGEEHILKRLEREKRVGRVEKLDSAAYRFSAEVYDTNEMLPWVRTFLCRIVSFHCSNHSVENRFWQDLHAMYKLYGMEKEKTLP